MAQRKLAPVKRDKPALSVKTASAPAAGWFSGRAIRETIESIAVAFVLALLFRTFEAEAFMIPTGSMAPTLMGAHKDLDCPQCGYEIRAGASGEEEQLAEQMGRTTPGVPVEFATCPMCRKTTRVGPGTGYATYGGDRILVNKFNYEYSEPQRWDIVVFKNPSEAQTNFIKRCVGLPNETIRIYHGDLYAKPDAKSPFALARRGPDELRAMAQIVYDNDYVDDRLTEAGWPLRWQALPVASAGGGASWKSDDGGRSFAIETSGGDAQWLRYRHFVPSFSDWQALGKGRMPVDSRPRPLLVTDFYAYDTSISKRDYPPIPSMLGLHWVGDLMLECELESQDGKGTAVLDLVEGGRHFRCHVNLETGEARLSIDGVESYAPKAQTSLRGTASHDVIFSNFDHQLCLWVDGSPMKFDAPTEYEPLGNDIPQSRPDDLLDLAPAGVGAQGASLSVRHMKLWRDIYYIATTQSEYIAPAYQPLHDYSRGGSIAATNYNGLYEFWSDPQQWEPAGRQSPFARRQAQEFQLSADQFFMLGDNSPASSDARLWQGEKYVARELLIGKALLVFWPHSFHQIPGTSIPFPFFPNFARMGLIR